MESPEQQPAAPPPLAAVGRIPSWKEARGKQMAETLAGMGVEGGLAAAAAEACGEDLNAALEYVRERGASVSAVPIGIGIGSGIGGGIGGAARGADADKENAGGRVRVWNQATCGYEWIKGVDAQADAEEAQIGAPRLPALHASRTRVDTALRPQRP